MKRLRIFLMAVIMAALVIIATYWDPINDSFLDIVFGFTSVDTEAMSTFPWNIPDDKYRKCATKNEAMASAKDEDGLHVGFQNNFTAEAIKIINS